MNNMNTEACVVRSILQGIIPKALNVYEKNKTDESLSDLYIKIDKENGIIEIYDDMEKLLIKDSTDAWSGNDNDGDAFFQEFAKIAKSVLNDLEKQSVFNKDFIYKPFAVNLIDDNFIIQEELLFLDDETLKISGESLMDLDKELNDFLHDLLKDVE